MLKSFVSKIITILLIGGLTPLPITTPQQVIWRDDNRILFVVEEKLLEYKIKEETLTEIGKREPNQFIGITKEDEIIYCNIEHYIISSPDEFSTKFTIQTPNGKKKELYFFETIRPLNINEERIIAVTALDFLEENFYKIDIESENKEKIPPLKKVKRTVLVPKDIQLKKAYVRNKYRYVIEDIFGNLYLFTQREFPWFQTLLQTNRQEH